MSPRVLPSNEPTRSSAEWEKKDPAVLKESPPQESYPDTVAYAEEDLFEEGAVDAVYQAKARVLNAAVREIGMGRYQVRCIFACSAERCADFEQWCLFTVAGFGWFSCVILSRTSLARQLTCAYLSQ